MEFFRATLFIGNNFFFNGLTAGKVVMAGMAATAHISTQTGLFTCASSLNIQGTLLKDPAPISSKLARSHTTTFRSCLFPPKGLLYNYCY